MADLLSLEGVRAGYGEAIVVSDITLTLAEGRSLAVLGRNGVGKTTLINTIIGVTRHRGGRVLLGERDVTRLRPDERARAGIGWTPQERNIFRSLTVEENLTAVARQGPWSLARIYEMFPRLAERRANLGNQLSGGEQQMLAIGRALVLNPKLLLLDEPTEGLSAIVIEQHAKKILSVTDNAVILERGMIVHRAESAALRDDSVTLDRYLGVTRKGAG